MDIDILELSDRKARFIISGVPTEFVNAIRRSIIAEVPIMAVDYINIYDNTSVLFDEQLALRLGLIPIFAKTKKFVFPEKCNCKGAGCPSCQVSLSLSAIGPTIAYSGQIVSSDPDVYPAEKTIPIVELKETHKVVVDMIAKLGTGRMHAKWQAGVACGYKNMPIINIDECHLCGKCVEICPRGVLMIGNNDNISVVDKENCSLCKLCEKICSFEAISISTEPNTFIMTYETAGSMTASDLLIEAVGTIKQKAEDIYNLLNAF